MTTASGDATYRTPLPRMELSEILGAGLPLASLLLKLRRLGRGYIFRVVRNLFVSAPESTQHWP